MPVQSPWQCRRLRLSIRILIALVLLIGTGLGWIVRSARIQRDAVEAIVKSGGAVKYDWEYKNGRIVRNAISGNSSSA